MKKIILLVGVFSLAYATGYAQADTLSITLENVAYPHPVSLFSVRADGQNLRMAYMDVAPASNGNGKTALLFHGKNFGGYYWTNVIDRLSRAGYRVIVPDQIGFGRSGKPFIHYSFHVLASLNKALIDSLGIQKVIVLGHSMGGMLATRFALLFPDRVEKLILEDPLGLEDYKTFVPYVSLEQQYQTELKASSESIRAYYKKYFVEWKPAYEKLVRIAAGVIQSADFPRYARVSAMTYQMIYEQPVVYEFQNLKVPVVLVIGTKDRTILGKDKLAPAVQEQHGNYAVLGKQVASRIPNCSLVELDAGHIPHLEVPEAFVGALLKSLEK